ncbi:MAG: ABC transporter ATP-binding protein [Clostridium sp.]|jgi:ABC-2 type transport system ATP-binding protein|nr:ABC transporter ATP-binding protein [Clostridium sp.]
MIEINNVTKVYGGKIKAVDQLSLDLNPGEIFGFLGPNGAGKTTTIKMLTGIVSADEGEITINGYTLEKDAMAYKKQFGFVPDNPDTFLRLKGIEYLNFMGDIYEVESKLREERIVDLAKRFDMTNALGDHISSYSHGMRQKIVLIGALIHNPSLWILDEPMTGLDPKSSFYLKEMMREHADQGNVVFFSTHVLEVAEKICDRVGIINKGKLMFCGTMTELRETVSDNEGLENIFLEMTND